LGLRDIGRDGLQHLSLRTAPGEALQDAAAPIEQDPGAVQFGHVLGNPLHGNDLPLRVEQWTLGDPQSFDVAGFDADLDVEGFLRGALQGPSAGFQRGLVERMIGEMADPGTLQFRRGIAGHVFDGGAQVGHGPLQLAAVQQVLPAQGRDQPAVLRLALAQGPHGALACGDSPEA
jgi:hypothetical protein